MLTYLLSLVSEEERDTVIRIYERYSARFMRIATRRLRRARIPSYERFAEDVVQTTFIRIIKYLDLSRYEDVNHTDFYRFSHVGLYSCISTVKKQEQERLKREVSADDVAEPFEEELIHERLEYKDAVAAIMKMDERYSTVLYLRYVEEIPPAEIAAQLNMSVGTVYSRIRRGVEILKKNTGGAKK